MSNVAWVQHLSCNADASCSIIKSFFDISNQNFDVRHNISFIWTSSTFTFSPNIGKPQLDLLSSMFHYHRETTCCYFNLLWQLGQRVVETEELKLECSMAAESVQLQISARSIMHSEMLVEVHQLQMTKSVNTTSRRQLRMALTAR